MKRKLQIIAFFAALFFLGSCRSDNEDIPDVSDIPVEFELTRTEGMIAKLDTNQANILAPLYETDSVFYSLFFEHILQVPFSRLSLEQKNTFIKGFISDSRIQRIQHEVDSVFNDFGLIEDQLAEVFQYAKYYFPYKNTPDIYTYISEFTYQRFIFQNERNDAIALGLDMFLGENYPYTKYVPNNTSFSSYLTKNYKKENIARNTAETLAEDWLSRDNVGETLLEQMIFHGKKLYIINKLIPKEEEHTVMGFTPEQYQWCKNNEQEMWSYFLTEKLFYSTDINKISKLVSPSPHSAGMPPEAPGRTANYMGWKIIEAFMKKNNYEAKEILSLDKFSAQQILEMSKFKPKRR